MFRTRLSQNGKGYPDISLLEPIAKVFGISLAELLAGKPVNNINISANILRSKFYVCPVCGNVIHSMGEAAISCHGVLLSPCQAEEADENHPLTLETVEDEYFIHIAHEMTKTHYISFIAALSPDGLQMVKLYPEGASEARVKMRAVRQILFYCNQDGLFCCNIKRRSK